MPAAIGLMAVTALGATAGSAAAPSSVGVEVLGTSQTSILAAGKVRAKVQTDVPGLIKVAPRAQLADASSLPARIGRSRRVRFEEPGSRMVRLRLSASGRSLIGDCKPKNLLVSARLKTGDAQAAATVRALATVPVAIDSSSCGAAQGTTGTGGSGGGGGGGGGGDPGACPPDCNVIPPATDYTGPPIDTANADRCDFLDPTVCLQPFPNDYFTVEDASTDTGLRLNLNLQSMPANKAGKPIDPTEQNLNDGFSPGNSITVRIPGLDTPQAFQNTGAVPITDIGAYDDPDQPIVVIDAATGQRQPIWSEIDYNPIDPAKGGNANQPSDRANVNLIIRPAVNFDEGARYIVALRNLRDTQDDPIEPPNAFEVYRDNLTTTDPAIENRRAHMEELFAKLGTEGIQRSSLFLTWDFTVASERNLTERALSIRDDAFSQLGDDDLADETVEGDSPDFTVTGSTDYPPCSAGATAACDEDITGEPIEDDQIARVVTGQITVPCFLNAPGCPPGSQFDFAAGSSVPEAIPGNTTTATFQCEIPRAAIDAPNAAPGRPSLYGHGLLGSASEVDAGNIKAMANEHDFVFCATDWAGFSTVDIPTVLLNLQDLSEFPKLADHMQQGFVNQLYLGRTMIHPEGLLSDPAFHVDGTSTASPPVIDNEQLFYDGNSQGGIMGGALTALSPDFTRAVLGVPGINYSTLLTRSVDFEPYAEGVFSPEICGQFPQPFRDICNAAPNDTPLGLYDNYPNKLERPLIFSLMQLLWDRGEGNGYAHHMTTEELEDTPEHTVLLHPAFGDHQVANVAAEVEARTIGASVYQPALEPDRYWAPAGIFGLPQIGSFPAPGSVLVYWDGGPVTVPDGSGTPPNENIPPRPSSGYGTDPHGYPRGDIKGRAQKSDFLMINGTVQNYCTAENSPDPLFSALVPNGTAIPCHSHGWTGLP